MMSDYVEVENIDSGPPTVYVEVPSEQRNYTVSVPVSVPVTVTETEVCEECGERISNENEGVIDSPLWSHWNQEDQDHDAEPKVTVTYGTPYVDESWFDGDYSVWNETDEEWSADDLPSDVQVTAEQVVAVAFDGIEPYTEKEDA